MSRRSLNMAQDTRAYTLLNQCGHTQPRPPLNVVCTIGSPVRPPCVLGVFTPFLMIWSLRTDRVTSKQPGSQTRCWGSWILTPCRLPFVRLALWADCLLLWGLVLAVLPPLFQLEVNEFPHHPGLCQADSCQTSHPKGWRGHPLRTAKAILLVNRKTKLWPFCCL